MIVLTFLVTCLLANMTAAFMSGKTGALASPCSRHGALRFASPHSRQISMRVAGQSAPFGFFDPIGLSPSDPQEFKRYQEAELKHGRVSMLAIVGLAVGENTSLLFGGSIYGPGIYQFQMADAQIPFFWAFVLFNVALIEGQTIPKGWESPSETSTRGGTFAGLKDSYTPGDLGWDPLNFMPRNFDDFTLMRTKELNNGTDAIGDHHLLS